jgi:pSer/pThr/pTyr-binding forkhead associated (FHA) protein
MAVLIGMSADVKGRTLEIEAAGLTIGRKEGNTAVIDNSSVSGRHCEITLEGDQCTLRDLGSTNGTRVNGEDITGRVLAPHDIVQIGFVDFVFNDEDIPLSEAEAIYHKTEVVESEGPAVRPESFSSISPFGARRRESQGALTMVNMALAVIALLAAGFFLFKLFTA